MGILERSRGILEGCNMTDRELIQWANDALTPYRERAIDMWRIHRKIQEYSEEITELHSSAPYSDTMVRVQEGYVNKTEEKVINLLMMKEKLVTLLYIHCTEDAKIFNDIVTVMPTKFECALTYKYFMGYTIERIATQMHTCPNTINRWVKLGLLEYGRKYYRESENSPNMGEIEGLEGK